MSTQMRTSKVLQKLRAGEIAYCTKLNLADARVAEIAAMAGFDCIWTDLEHVPNDWSVVEKQIYAGKAHHVDTIVRVAKGSYSDYIRPLEMDAAGIMIPHIMSLDEAKSIVRNTKFYPLGLRPLDGGNADAGYCTVPLVDYMRTANDQRFIILQIEDPEPLSELEQIAELSGVDMLFFGPGDFSQAIGEPGNLQHLLVREARQRVAAAAVKAGKFAGTVGTPDNCKELIALGYRFISIGADVVGLSTYFRKLLQDAPDSAKNLSGLYG